MKIPILYLMYSKNKPETLTSQGGAIPNYPSGSNLSSMSCMPFLPMESSARALAVYISQLLLLLFLTSPQGVSARKGNFLWYRDPFICAFLPPYLCPTLCQIQNRQTAKDVRASYDALVDIFECIENFLRRLSIYTEIPPTPVMTEIVIKIMAELIAVLALATKQINQGRLSTSALANNCS